jgi:hypothetical protein
VLRVATNSAQVTKRPAGSLSWSSLRPGSQLQHVTKVVTCGAACISSACTSWNVLLCGTDLPSNASTDIALPLALAAASYAHQGHVLFAEGLLRKAAEQLQLRTDGSSDGSSGDPVAGESLAVRSAQALVAWSLGQLFSVIPKRETEARKWLHLGEQRWPFGSEGQHAISSQLGAERALAGHGTSESPAVISFLLKRAFLGSS